jgi:hypothetical protein
VFSGYVGDVEQVGKFDWTFINGRQLHENLFPMGYLLLKTSIRGRNAVLQLLSLLN